MPNGKVLSSINFSTQVIDDVKAWLTTHVFPNYIKTPEQRDHYSKVFGEFKVRNGDLYYEQRRAIPEDDPTAQRDAIQHAYDSPAALGKGINLFFAYIETMYLGDGASR